MKQTDLTSLQHRITIVWLLFAALIFVRNVVMLSKSPEIADVVWSWYSTSILPTSGLIFGLWLAVIRDNRQTKAKVAKMSANLTQGIVYFYIAMVLLTIALDTVFANKTPQEHYADSQQWLAIIQVPLLAFLGKVFSEKRI